MTSRSQIAPPQIVVYLMRGLPGCGKSHRAQRLAGVQGIVLETDEYFYTQVGDDPRHYDFDSRLLPAARLWIMGRFRDAIASKISPIVLDRGNGLNQETQDFALYAQTHGCLIELAEPDSPWWQELRILLKYKQYVAGELFDMWAESLSRRTRESHRVPASRIRAWMQDWKHDLTVDEILAGGILASANT